MNVHLFYVNRGEMLTFDMNYAVESVSRLQAVVRDEIGIPVDRQVLLISGGEAMDPKCRVCDYSSGTDTCPIFLFNLKAIEEKNPPDILCELDTPDIQHRIEGSLGMPVSLNTLSARTQLALELRDHSRKHADICRSLVHHQHLQHQGWKTAVVNMEDMIQSLTEQVETFSNKYQNFLRKKQEYVEMISSIPSSLDLLSKTPLLNSLRDVLKEERFGGIFKPDAIPSTLMEFVDGLDKGFDIVADGDKALVDLEKLDEELLEKLLEEAATTLEAADNPSMKEVKGLEGRLYGLDQLLANTSKIVKDQELYAQGFVHNQNRYQQQGADRTILPDLCSSHKQQLRYMESRDSDIRKVVNKIIVAKKELGANLHARLRWAMFVEKRSNSVSCKISLYCENLKRLTRRLDRLEQISRAPVIYARLCSEVYRRRILINDYHKWAQVVRGRAANWNQEETRRRRDFYKFVGKHFLKVIFPDLDKLPSAILMVGSEAESCMSLPVVNDVDILSLRDSLPELKQWLDVLDTGNRLSSSSTQSHQSLQDQTPQLKTKSDKDVIAPSGTDDNVDYLSETTPDVGGAGSSELVPVGSNSRPVGAEAAHLMDAAPDSLSDADEITDGSLCDDGERFLTANYSPGSQPPAPLFHTPDKEKASPEDVQVDRLTAENSLLKWKCSQLSDYIRTLRADTSFHIQTLRDDSAGIRSELDRLGFNLTNFTSETQSLLKDRFANHMDNYQRSQITSKQGIQRLQDQLEATRADAKSEQQRLSSEVQALQRQYEETAASLEKALSTHRVELEIAIAQAEASSKQQLMLQHEVDLETLNDQHSSQIQVLECDVASRDAEIQQLQTEICELRDEIQCIKTEKARAAIELSCRRATEFSFQLSLLTEQKNAEVVKVCSEMEEKLQQALSEADAQKIAALNAMESSLESKHQRHLQSLVKETIDRECNTNDKFLTELRDELRAADKEEWNEVIKKREDELEQECLKQIEEQAEKHQQEMLLRAATMKDSLQAVNEAKLKQQLTKLRKEKDLMIAELQRQLEVASVGQQVEELDRSIMVESVVAIETPAAKVTEEQIQEKDELIKELQSQIDTLSLSASTAQEALLNDKVTVKSINIGDKVILCFDERHDHYVVFSLNNTLHFLHGDSLQQLGLVSSLRDDKIRPWVLAEIIEKEYCQARKPMNRFRLPVGTKFYRVKAKPWETS